MRAEILVNRPSVRSQGHHGVKSKASRDFLIVMLLALIHLPLGVALYNTGSAGIAHPIFVFCFGLYLALKKKVNTGHVACVVAYIIGAEVLWRMASVPAPWEFGKYASAGIMLAAIFRSHRLEVPKLPLLYLGLLVPSCLIVIAETDLSRVSAALSFNMSGPVLLLVSAWFFYKTRISPSEFRRLLIAFTLPLLSVAMSALFYTVTAEDLSFTGESNFATSGGFGPNQVSSMLGLGVYVSAAGLLIFKKRSKFSVYFAFAALFFATLSVMTFSRGGMYNAVGGIFVLLIFGLRDVSSGLRRLAPAVILAALFVFFIYPMLNDFTGGALQERFEDTGTSQRSDIAWTDVEMFMDNPAFGVGVGASYAIREKYYHKAMAHTEFARMISEHGSFGLAAILVMLAFLIANLKRPNSTPGRAFIAGALTWACLFMMNAGMRLAAPAFIWGLSFITIVSLRPHLGRAVGRVMPRRKFEPSETVRAHLPT